MSNVAMSKKMVCQRRVLFDVNPIRVSIWMTAVSLGSKPYRIPFLAQQVPDGTL